MTYTNEGGRTDIYVYGAGNNGRKLAAVSLQYEEIHIVNYIDQKKVGRAQGVSIIRINDPSIRKDIPVVISIGQLRTAKEVYDVLVETGFQQIYWFSPKDSCYQKSDFLTEQCRKCDFWSAKRIMPQVEMHISDSCNLNCRGCTHFSPIFQRIFPDMGERLQDVRDLKEKFDYIIRFYILGGEPFLNPEIGRYVSEISRILPKTEIVIVTNGLLLCKADAKTLHAIQEAGAVISISEYAPTARIIDDIRRILEQNNILYEIRKAASKQKFNIPLALDPNSSREKCCISDGCITIWNGRIARCPTLMYIEKFNEVFDTALPSEGIYNLRECPEGEELLKLMSQPVPLCRHCVINETEWSTCGSNPKLEDFATYD